MKELITVQQLADQYKLDAKKTNTKVMYHSALKKYLSWCIQSNTGADKSSFIFFLEAEKQKGTKWSSLRLYRYAIQAYFVEKGIAFSGDRDLNNFFKAMKNIAPIKQVKQEQARPLSVEKLLYVIDQIEDLKYRALFLLMYRGGFRISEIVGICVEDIRLENDFMVITINRSKTGEQTKYIKLPADTRYCPYVALLKWGNIRQSMRAKYLILPQEASIRLLRNILGMTTVPTALELVPP
ncbi:MAG: tyrosine-type recombinase/integrase [Saprospiraceae bacterium]|nr:tyrosine-type recombinase/integrase [Saprospiraceae bacterium]